MDVGTPAVGDGELLVRVRAASVNPLDWHFMRGAPYLVRTMAGLSRPKPSAGRLGADMAGSVEAVGRNVTGFQPGDEVFGGLEERGTLAEYISIRADAVVLEKPAGLTFEQAAAVPVAAFTALQALRDKGRVQPGQKVLVSGASGGVGTFAVQIAKALGAEVTAVCSTANVDLAALRELLDDGKVTPVIDRTYPLNEVAEAVRYLETGHARGKVVVTV